MNRSSESKYLKSDGKHVCTERMHIRREKN
jgi:hypothetical protein